MSTIVLKLGSSVLSCEADLDLAVHEIYRHLRRGERVVAVVSAIGRTTDALLQRAERFETQSPEAVATLLATGESQSAALLVLALARAGTDAALFDASRLGLRTTGPRLDATLVDLDLDALESALDRHRVAVVPGFVGRDAGCPTLLGRGGSDLTALFLAHRLGADCRLVKDVDGIYDRDPAQHPGALRYAQLNWDEAIAVGGRIVQPKAIAWARDAGVPFQVARLGDDSGTWVGGGPSALRAPRPRQKLKIALLGLGTVGLGVYRLLSRHPDLEVVGIGVRDERPREAPPELVTTDLAGLVRRDADVVIELIGGLDPARALVEQALEAGCHVVTANKALIAACGPELHALAERSGRRLRYSAAVGGAVPVIEHVRALREIDAIDGVLNGTCNYVLDRLHDGNALADAIAEARRAGFTEADPSLDLDGHDAAHKIAVLCREAWGDGPVDLDPLGLSTIDADAIRTARERGQRIRLVARCRREGDRIVARVAPEAISEDHPLGEARGAQNCVVVTHSGGETILRGLGAGRYPTATSVVADLLELQEAR